MSNARFTSRFPSILKVGVLIIQNRLWPSHSPNVVDDLNLDFGAQY